MAPRDQAAFTAPRKQLVAGVALSNAALIRSFGGDAEEFGQCEGRKAPMGAIGSCRIEHMAQRRSGRLLLLQRDDYVSRRSA